ncbi:DUF6602 domain-containing protein [Pseudonocardia sp. N23]|uniref:DUF6602 domain-containing protein n=1 Tax=Pseudonocardia sp. N23 TaxID=1987376 RepID=UPI001145B57E|nr:DUF6602 domain-containing protein [Pseudonocardia sp. N23]
MIRSFADLLQEVMRRESAVLADVKVKHAPTIGEMYEGLSKKLLATTFPADLDLRVVSGFVADGDNLSGQIDCMLVRGAGNRIPYTQEFVWSAPDVLAVFEVKKTLTGRAMSDAFEHLKTVRRIEQVALDAGTYDSRSYTMKLTDRTFAQMTGKVKPPQQEISSLSPSDQILLSILTLERISAILVVVGYDGFKTERGFRNSLIKHLSVNLMTHGFSPLHFPTLMISGKFALVKANGLPYMTTLKDGRWPFYLSTSANPLVVLLELLWTRIEADFPVAMPWGEDLEIENLNRFIDGRVCELNDQTGWEYSYVDAAESTFLDREPTEIWEPVELNAQQGIFFLSLHKSGPVALHDPLLARLAADAGVEADVFISSLVETTMVAVRNQELVPITEEFTIVHMPDGRTVAADNSTGRLTRWVLARSRTEPS